MKHIDCNLLHIKEGYVCHQVNCKGVMGAGLARGIKTRYPTAYKDYIKAFDNKKIYLGNIIVTHINNLHIVHMCGQYNYGKSKVYTNYDAFEECLVKMIKFIFNTDLVYFPYKIGCGLAGGDWTIISELIEKYLPQSIICHY